MTRANERDVKTACNGRRRRGIPLPFDTDAARAYGRIFAAVKASGRTHRSRLADLRIASTAVANELAIYTRTPSDLEALENIVDIVAV